MNKRKGESLKPMRRSTRHKPLHGFYTPFQELDQLFGRIFSSHAKHLANLDPFLEKNGVHLHRIKVEADEDCLFQTAMADVSPLPAGPCTKVPLRSPEKKYPRFFAREQIEAYTQLVDLVAGEGPFELSSSDEYIDGAVLGISPEVLKKLREGYFSYMDYLDLHGLNRQQAREKVRDFIMECFAARRRCVLIIAGRGLNSKDKEPVLKNNLPTWLRRAPLKRMVLAFASARSYDGGWGAFYVLLRKNEGKDPLVTPAR
ncbi:MAG TPA: DNA mismatch repair protein MutS [Deltaproteobacteria bacterium]|jgi:DNA-nicking Smr family endonuclease|nr:DNA mismatch repair protein MutS [Deltaproteobacteria bacterium]